MSTESEIGIIAAVDGDAATARWRVSQPSSEAQVLPPLQVQSLPGNQINSLFEMALSPDGAWHIGEDDRVYYAPYQTGVFAPILTMPVDRSEYITRVAVPGHLIIHHVGTRRVSIISLQYGLILDQVLPALPTGSDPDTEMIGVVYEGDSADRIAIMFQSLDGHLRGYSHTTMEPPGVLFGVMPRVDVLTYSGPEYLWKSHALIGLAAHAYQIPDIRGFFAGGTAGRASPAGIYSYEFTTPDPEVNPGLGVQDYAVTASPVSTLTWGPSGASATLYMDTVEWGSGYKWDSFPVPVTTSSSLTIRIEPVLLGTTHGTINIGGVAYPLQASNSDSSFSSNTTFYSDRIRLNDMLLAAGGTYPVSLSIFTSSSGSRTTPITLVSGGDSYTSGFSVGEFGSVSTTNVFQEGGVVRHLVRLESNRVNITREPWSGGLVWLMPPSRPPFWTGFVRTIEDINAGTTPDPGPDPDPDPDPDPGLPWPYADVVMVAGDAAPVGEGAVGYIAGLAGSVTPVAVEFDSISAIVEAIVHAPGEGGLVVSIAGIAGATDAVIEIQGVRYPLTIIESVAGVAAVTTVDPGLVIGESYNVRLYLDGELSSTDQDVVFDTTVTIGDLGDSLRGFDVWGEVGDLDPFYFPVGEASVYVDILAFAPSELMYPESPGRTLVVIEMYCEGAGPGYISLESASLAFNGLIVELDHIEISDSTVVLVGLLPESAGNWMPDFDDQLPATLTLQGFEIPDSGPEEPEEPEEPYEPVGDPITITIEAVGEYDAVGFGYNRRGSVAPSTIEYEGRTLTIVAADMYDYGDGDVWFDFEMNGNVTGLTFAGAGFDIGGVLVGAEVGNYETRVRFPAWHDDLQPWQDGETYTITFYPGQEG